MNTPVSGETGHALVPCADTPERWAHALDHALHAGVEIYVTPSGERFASTGSHLDVIYQVTEGTCECSAAKAGDPICCHRAALRSVLDTLPVVVVHVDDLGEPVAHADTCNCDPCRKSFELLMWGWMTNAYGAVADLERRVNRVFHR